MNSIKELVDMLLYLFLKLKKQMGFYTFKLRKKSNSNFEYFFVGFLFSFILTIFQLISFLNVFFIFCLMSCIYFFIFSKTFNCCNFTCCNVHKLYFSHLFPIIQSLIRAIGRLFNKTRKTCYGNMDYYFYILQHFH